MLRMRFTTFALGAILLVLASCGDSRTPTDPGLPPAPELTLADSLVTITEIGASHMVHAKVGVRTVHATLTVVSEERWLEEAPVLDAAALSESTLMALAPGTVRIAVSASDLPAKEMSVTVAPDAPYITREWSDEGGFHIRGYRLHAVDAGSAAWDGMPASILHHDSSTLSVTLPPALPGCTGGAYAELRLAAGADTLSAKIRRERSDEVSLSIGEYRLMTPGEIACLQLAPDAQSEYAVAYLDQRALIKSQTDGREHEVFNIGSEFVAHSRPHAASSVQLLSGAAPSFALAPSHIDRSASTATDARITLYDPREQPWKVGDTFLYQPVRQQLDTAYVVKLYDNGFVLAAMRDVVEHVDGDWEAEFSKSISLMNEHGLPYLQRVLGVTHPETAAGTGQFVFVAASLERALGSASSHDVVLRVDRNGEGARLTTVSHEMAHVYQQALRLAGRSSGSNIWASEGGANFLRNEIHRIISGTAFDANSVTREEANDGTPHAGEAVAVAGDFAYGYSNSANYFRYLVHQLMRTGIDYDTAVRTVMSGSLEGWFTLSSSGLPLPSGQGLQARLRPHLGSDWNPSESLLQWTLSLWADDWTDNPDLQQPLHEYAFGRPGRTVGGFLANILAGNEPGRTVRSHPVTSGHGVFALHDHGFGGSYSFSTDAPNAAWMIARIR